MKFKEINELSKISQTGNFRLNDKSARRNFNKEDFAFI